MREGQTVFVIVGNAFLMLYCGPMMLILSSSVALYLLADSIHSFLMSLHHATEIFSIWLMQHTWYSIFSCPIQEARLLSAKVRIRMASKWVWLLYPRLHAASGAMVWENLSVIRTRVTCGPESFPWTSETTGEDCKVLYGACCISTRSVYFICKRSQWMSGSCTSQVMRGVPCWQNV